MSVTVLPETSCLRLVDLDSFLLQQLKRTLIKVESFFTGRNPFLRQFDDNGLHSPIIHMVEWDEHFILLLIHCQLNLNHGEGLCPIFVRHGYCTETETLQANPTILMRTVCRLYCVANRAVTLTNNLFARIYT